MGRNSKKNKGRKPTTAEQGFKEAASLATSSAVSSTPSRPARTAKHKVRKFPPQLAPTTSSQATESYTARGLKKTQPVLAPNTGKQETTSSGPSATRTTENLPTSKAILTQSAVVIEEEVTLHQPTSANLSDSYDSSSASSSETEMGAQNAAGHISNIDNATEMLKIEQKGKKPAQKLNVLNQNREKPEGLDADKYTATLPAAMESKIVPPRDNSNGHTPAVVAGLNVKEPFASLSPRLHSKIQADEKNVTFEDNATPMGTSLLEVSHHKHEVLAVSSSCFITETWKQTAADESTSDPARENDSKLLNIERHVSERSNSGNETTLSETMVTSCTSTDNLKHEKAEKQQLEIVKAAFDKGLQEDEDHVPAKKNDEPADFACEIGSVKDTPAHQVLPSAAEYNVEQEPLEMNDLQEDTNEESKQVNQCGIGETPPYSVQEPSPKKVDEQPVEKDAQEPPVGTLQQQERNVSEKGISNAVIENNLIQAIDTKNSSPSLEGEALNVEEQELYAEIKPEHEPEELQPVRVEEESATSIHATMPAGPADECKQDTQDSHSENLSTSVNAASEEETDEEKLSASQILGRPEDVDVTSEVQIELPEAAPASEKHHLLNSDQYILELVETEAKSTAIDTTSACQGKPEQIHIGSRNEEHIVNSLENQTERLQVAEKQVEHKEEVKDQDEQHDQLDRGTLFEGHSINSARKMEKLDVPELQVKSTSVNQEECQEEKPDLAHGDSVCEEHKTKKPDKREPQIACVNLDKECQEENPDQAYNDSVCKSEEAIVEMEEPKFERAALEEKGCQEKMPDHINELDEEIEVEHVALHEEKDSQDDKQHQLDRGTTCENHAANFTESEIDEVQVGDPGIRDVTLDKEDYQASEHGHGGSICKELILTDTGSQENATDRLDVGEPMVGNIMLHEDQKCKEDEPDQQLDRGIVGTLKPIESEMEKLEVAQTEVKSILLDKSECLQDNPNLARSDSVCEEDKTTESLKFTERKFDMGEPLIGGDKEQEGEEGKLDGQLGEGTTLEEQASSFAEKLAEREPEPNPITLNKEECQEKETDQLGEGTTLEEHASSFAEKLAEREPEPGLITLNKEECQEEKTDQALSSYVHEESKTEDNQENVDKHDSQVDGTLDIDRVRQEEKFGVREPLVRDNQEGQEGKLDQQLDEDTACEEHANSIVSEIEKLVEPDLISLNKEECQEEEIEEAHSSSVHEESNTEHTQENADKLVSQVDLTLDINRVHQEGKFDEGKPLAGDDHDQEGQVDQRLDEGGACDYHANSIVNEIEKLVEPELITLNNEECQEEGTGQAHNSPVCKERKTEETQEHVEKLVSEVDVMLDIDQVHQEKFGMKEQLVGGDKDQECQEEKLNQELSDGTPCEEHANPIASEIEKPVVQEPEPDLITLNSEDCQEEATDQQVHCSYVTEESKTEGTLENVDKLDSQLDVTLNIDHEHKEEKPDQVDSNTVSQEGTKSSANEIEKLEVEALETTGAIQAKECVENRYINSVEEAMDQTLTEVESIPVEEKAESSEKMPERVEIGNGGKEHDTPSTENQVEKPELQELEVEGAAVAVHKDKEILEDKLDRLDRGNVCEEQAKPGVKSETEQAEVESPKVKLDKEEGERDQQLESDLVSVREEHQQINFLEDATEKTDVGEPEVGIMLVTHIPDQVDSDSVYQKQPTSSTQKEIQKLKVGEPEVGIMLVTHIPDQVDSDSVYQKQPTSSTQKEIEQLKVGESERSIAIEEEKECQEEHATTKFTEQGMEQQPKPEAESGTLENSKEEMPDPTDSGCVYKDHESHVRENDLKKVEVGEPEVEGVTRDIQEDQLDSLTGGEYAKTCIEHEMEKLEGEKPKVALEREEPDEDKYDQADGNPLCKEHLKEHPVEKPQVEDVMLDKDWDFPAGQVSNASNSRETDIAIKEANECLEEHTTNPVEEGKEQPKPEVESAAALEDKKESPNEMPVQIESGDVCEEYEVQVLKTELEKPEVEETKIENVSIYKKDSQEDKPNQLETDDIERLDIGRPELNSRALDTEECEEQTHSQADDGAVCEGCQVADSLVYALEKTEKDPISSVADELKKLELGESAKGTECQEEHATKSVDNEVKQPEKEEEIVTLEGYQEEHTTKSIDPEVEQLETEEERDSLRGKEHATKSIDDEAKQPETEEESAAPEDQIASSHLNEEYEMSQEHPTSSEERELEPLEVRQSQIAAADREEQECQVEHSINSNKEIVTLDEGKESPEDHPTKSADDEAEQPEAEEARATLEEEEQTTKSVDNEMKQPETEEESAALEERADKMPDQIVSSHVCEDSEENNMSPEHPTSSKVERPETEGESAPLREEEHASKSVDDGAEQPETEEESAALEDQIASSHVSDEYEMSPEHPTSFEERELESLEVRQSQTAATDKEEQECQEELSINTEKKLVTLEGGKDCPEENTTESADDEAEQPEAEKVRATLEEEERTTKSIDNEMKQPETEEESAALEESSDKMPDQTDSSHAYEDSEENDMSPAHQTSSEEKELEALEARQSQIAIAVKEERECQEQHGINSEENGVKMTVPEVESTILEESPEQKLDQADGSYISEEPEMHTIARELGNPVVEEPEVKNVAIHKKEDQIDQLESTVCEGHKDNPVENEAEKPQVNSAALDKEECEEEKHDQADSGCICEEHQVADFNVKKPDVKEPQLEVVILNNDQELPEEELEQVGSDSVSKDHTSYLGSKPEVGKSEADMPHHEETEYRAEILCQLDVYDHHSTNSSESKKEHKEKEPEVESAPIEESKECKEDISDQVESYSACNEHETKCPEMEHPELEGAALQQKIERKESQAKDFYGIITNSVEENLERLEVGESQVDLALKEKEDCQPDHADNTSSVCEEPASKSEVRELNLDDLEEPEAADVTCNETEYQVGDSLHQKNENEEGGAEEVRGSPPNDFLITDSLGKDLERLEVVDTHVDLALQQEDSQANHTELAHEEQATTYVASAPKLELEEPEEGVLLDKVEPQDVEHGEAHSSSICKEQKEIPEMEEQKVDGVELDDEKPADTKILSQGKEQAAHSLESEIENIKVADPEITIEDDKEQQDENPKELNGCSTCEELEVEEQVETAALKKKKECQEENFNQVEKEPEPSDVVLDEITKCDKMKPDQITSGSECEQHPAISACEELDRGEQEMESAAIEERKECQENSQREAKAGDVVGDEIKDCDEDKPDQIDSRSECEQHQAHSACEELEVGETRVKNAALEEKKECQEENSDQAEREPEARSVMGDETGECDKDKADGIESHSECEQHPEISMKHEREKLAEEEPECPRKEECKDEDTEQFSSGFVCEDQATNTADTEKKSFEEQDPEVASILVSNEECQKVNPEQYTTRPMNIDKLEVGNSDERQTTDFVRNETKESEVGVPPVEDLDKKECQSGKLYQIMSSYVSEEHAPDLKEHGMDMIQVSQPELGSIIAMVEKNECQEEIPDDANNRPACETKTTEEDVVTVEENEECQIDNNTYLSETQKVKPVENETKKPKVGVPEVETDELDTMECQSEEANQANSSSPCEDHETSSKEEDTMPYQVADNNFASEAYTATIEKNEAGKPQVEGNIVDENEGQSNHPDEPRGSSVGKDEEHASDSIEADMDKLEMKQSVVGLPPQVTSSRSVGEAEVTDTVEHGAEKPAVEDPAVEDDEPREKEYQPEHDAVCAGQVSDCKEDHTNELEMPDLGVTSTMSVVEACTLDSLKSDTETQLGELEIEDKILDNKESSPDQDKSSSVCEEREINFQKDEVSKLEIQSDQDITDSTAVDDAHMLDPDNETEKAEEQAPQVIDNVPEQKESLGDKPYQDSHEVQATNPKGDNVDEEVNLAEEEKPDQAINGSIFVIETHTVHPLGNETEKPEGMPEVADNVLGQTKYPDEKPGSGSAYGEHAPDNKEDETIEPDKNQPQVGQADQMTAVSASVSEIDSLMNESDEKLEEMHEIEENLLEQNECLGEKLDQDGSSSVFNDHVTNSKEDGINKPRDESRKLEDKVMEQKECSGEIPDPDDSSYLFVEHATHYQEDDMDKLEMSHPEVEESDQVNASSTSESEPQTLDTFRNETKKPEEGVLAVENGVDALKECLRTTPEQDESSTFCEEHAAQSGTGMAKLEVNKAEDEEPHQIARSAPLSETHTHDSKAEMNEGGTLEVENNVLKEKAGEISDQGESSSKPEEQATDSKEDNIYKLEVNLPQPDQHKVLEEKGYLGKKPDHDERSSVCEEHAAGSTEGADRVEPERTQLITPLSEKTLNSIENETEKPKVGVPEVEREELASSTFSTIQEVSTSSEEDYPKIKGEEQEHPLDALSTENREDASHFLSISQDVRQISIHDFSPEENVQERDLSEMHAEGKHDKEFEQAPGNSKNQEASENDSSSLEKEHLPVMSQIESEEIAFRQTTDKNNAHKPHEGTQEISEELNTAKPEEAKQEPVHCVQSLEEDQEIHLVHEPALSSETQKCESIDAAIPFEIISAAQEANNVNKTQDGQEVEAKEVRTPVDTLPSQCQGVSLPTLAPTEVQEQEAIPMVDGGTELSARQPSPLDVKETLSDMEYKDEAREEQSPQSVLEEQVSPAEDEKQHGIQKVAAMQYQVDNAEQPNDQDVETLDTDQTNTTEKQPGQEEACKDVAALIVEAEQPNIKGENKVASAECDKDTLYVETKELALTQHDFYTERMKMVPEMSGESNKNVFEARNISEESETQTAASTDAPTNEKITAAQMPDGDIGFEPKQGSDQNSLHLQKIHKPILSGNERKDLAGINHVKGNFQVVEEISAAPEEQKHGFHLEEPAPIHIPHDRQEREVQKPKK